MSNQQQFESFEAYIANQPEDIQRILHELSTCILSVVPEATMLINYNILAFALIEGGKSEEQVMIAAYKKHIGFYPHPTTMTYFWDRFDGYKKAKGSVQFPIDQPLPFDLIKEMVIYRKKLIESSKTKK